MMYNANLKKEFIEFYTKSESTKVKCENIFNKTGEIEYKYNTDLCYITDRDKLLEIVSCVSGNKSRGTNSRIIMLRQYVQWCSKKMDGVTDSLKDISAKDVNIIYIQNHMASDPKDFKKYMDSFLRADNEFTTDIIYKCLLWLGYAGFPEGEALNLRNSNVNLEIVDDVFVITYDDQDYFVPSVAEDVFRKCVELKAFNYSNANYVKGDIVRDRLPGDILLRGVRSTSKSFKVLAQNISNRAMGANMKRRINYTNASLSGFFYHLYSLEQNNEIDFMFYAKQYVDKREYKLDKTKLTLNGLQTKIAKELEFDYNLWKLAFKK